MILPSVVVATIDWTLVAASGVGFMMFGIQQNHCSNGKFILPCQGVANPQGCWTSLGANTVANVAVGACVGVGANILKSTWKSTPNTPVTITSSGWVPLLGQPEDHYNIQIESCDQFENSLIPYTNTEAILSFLHPSNDEWAFEYVLNDPNFQKYLSCQQMEYYWIRKEHLVIYDEIEARKTLMKLRRTHNEHTANSV